MSLAPYVATLGRGPGRSRSLTYEESFEAMTIMLGGQAAPEAVGALLMLLRMKGETADEIAGFSAAARSALGRVASRDLDWPAYAAGRSRGQPWFLLSAKLVASAGCSVMLHGWNSRDASVRDGVNALAIPEYRPDQDQKICYAPLERLHPALFDLLKLRDVLGLRSCINTVCRMLNPSHASASVQGVFHPSYRLLQADAAQTLGLANLSVIKGGGGEFERHPSKSTAIFGIRAGDPFDTVVTPLSDIAVRLQDGPKPDTLPAGLWSGAQHDDFAKSVVLGTAILALETLGHADAANVVNGLWDNRDTTDIAPECEVA
jgi:anthranilate phosphoribosyltransferase